MAGKVYDSVNQEVRRMIDKDKQREANRERQRRYKARQKALLSEGVTGVTSEGVTDKALPEVAVLQEDYEIKAHSEQLKRGKDIKCFGDLPADVQETIDKMSLVDGKIDQTIKANRTAIAVNYQHLFPGRFHSTGVAI